MSEVVSEAMEVCAPGVGPEGIEGLRLESGMKASVIRRRKFLKQIVAATGLVATEALLSPLAWAVPNAFAPGIQLYSVLKSINGDVHGTLTKLAAIGFKEVESIAASGDRAIQLKRILDEVGLRCPSAHVFFPQGKSEQAFADVRALGARFAVTSVLALTVLKGKLPITVDDFQRIAEEMNRIGKSAKENGIIYAYHNHNFEFVSLPGGKTGYEVLLDNTSPDTVKMELDCGWMMAAGADPISFFARYPNRFRMLHVKDFKPLLQWTTDLFGKKRPQGTELGRGFIDYGPIFAAARASGVEHAFIEQEPPYALGEIETAKINYDYLSRLE